MADLDDFFAKKDKKKAKKPKFLTAEELVKNLEETSKREVVKPKKPETAPVIAAAPTTEVGGAETEEKVVVDVQEDEWKEVEEEQRKDYSGLKIGQLTLNDDDELSGDDGEEDDGESDGNANSEMGKKSGGVWKKVIPAEEVTQIPMEMPPKPVSKVYVSPALRAAQQGAGIKPKVRSKTAPDITNADFFPTLGAARPEEQRKKKNEPAFEEVRHGGRLQRVKEQTTAPSAATNRFQSLDDES